MENGVNHRVIGIANGGTIFRSTGFAVRVVTTQDGSHRHADFFRFGAHILGVVCILSRGAIPYFVAAGVSRIRNGVARQFVLDIACAKARVKGVFREGAGGFTACHGICGVVITAIGFDALEAGAHAVAHGVIAPAAVCMVELPTPIGRQFFAWVMPQAIVVAPFVARLVVLTIGQGRNTIAAAAAVVDKAIGILPPSIVRGDLLEFARIRLRHIVAGLSHISQIDADTDLGFAHILPHIARVPSTFDCAAAIYGLIVNTATGDDDALERHIGVAAQHHFRHRQRLEVIRSRHHGVDQGPVRAVHQGVCQHAQTNAFNHQLRGFAHVYAGGGQLARLPVAAKAQRHALAHMLPRDDGPPRFVGISHLITSHIGCGQGRWRIQAQRHDGHAILQ